MTELVDQQTEFQVFFREVPLSNEWLRTQELNKVFFQCFSILIFQSEACVHG